MRLKRGSCRKCLETRRLLAIAPWTVIWICLSITKAIHADDSFHSSIIPAPVINIPLQFSAISEQSQTANLSENGSSGKTASERLTRQTPDHNVGGPVADATPEENEEPEAVENDALEEDAEDEEEEEDDDDDAEDEEEDDDGEETFLHPKWHTIGPVSIECRYGGEFFNKARGGLTNRSATRYRGCLDLMFTLETEQAGWWSGGKFWAYAFSTHGRTLSEQFVGDSQWYSSNDTGLEQDITDLGEYWYQHSFLDERLNIALGRQDPSWHFGFADLAGDFINSSFLTLGNIPMPTWPYQTLGVTSQFQADERWKLSCGTYEQGRDREIWTATNTNSGMFSLGQIDFQPFSPDNGRPLTILRAGGWYASSNPEAIDGSRVFDNNYGFYSTLDRMLWSESIDPSQGLGGFVMGSWAPEDRNQVDWNYGAGIVYRGLFSGRDQDTFGLGVTTFHFSSILRNATGATSEDAVELFYKAQLRHGVTVQPDLQYIARPSGLEKDALLLGVRLEILL